MSVCRKIDCTPGVTGVMNNLADKGCGGGQVTPTDFPIDPVAIDDGIVKRHVESECRIERLELGNSTRKSDVARPRRCRRFSNPVS